VKKNNLHSAIVEASKKDRFGYKWRYIIGAERNPSRFTALFSPYALHSCPLSINAVTNAILRQITKKNFRIHVSSHPMAHAKEAVKGPGQADGLMAPLFFGLLTEIGFIVFAAIFIVFPIAERLCKVST